MKGRQPLLSILAAVLLPGSLSAGVNSWTTNPPAGATGIPVMDSTTGALYLSTFNGLVRSGDHGSTWIPFCMESGLQAVPLAARGGAMYALSSSGSLYASTNPGGHCAVVSENVLDTSVGEGQQLIRAAAELVLDPFTPGTIYRNDIKSIHTVGVGLGSYPTVSSLARSTDGGASWSALPWEGFNGYVSQIAADPGTRGVLYATTNGVILGTDIPTLYRSEDGGSSWAELASIPESVYQVSALAVDRSSPTTIYVDGWRSTDGGVTFSKFGGDDTQQIVPDDRHLGRFYVATYNRGVLRSDDGGETWVPMNAGFTQYDTSVGWLAIEPNSVFLHAMTQEGIHDFEVVDPGALILDSAHPFSISLSAIDQRTGRVGAGVATPMNDLWGYFSIPAITGNPNNPEVFVKMLDGTALNGAYWFFYGGLTDLEYTLTVTEAATGKQKTYAKPAGSECGGSDTAAFTP
jgi:photosystem II stability/assembly factor-like uncharacterized protein